MNVAGQRLALYTPKIARPMGGMKLKGISE